MAPGDVRDGLAGYSVGETRWNDGFIVGGGDQHERKRKTLGPLRSTFRPMRATEFDRLAAAMNLRPADVLRKMVARIIGLDSELGDLGLSGLET
jgi:hypothetical protein